MTPQERNTIEMCATHFANTAMMNVPVTMSARVFVEAVTEKFKAICDELIREKLRRANQKQP